ncbi:MAG: hypothetical protein HC923_04940 [Myxococcales bacterium]|nr:hypothetical protein [Myxococcales bacterium]
MEETLLAPGDEGRFDEEEDRVATLAELPLRLSVELGRLTLTLSQISTLRPGQVILLDERALRHIRLVADGRVVGHGELVELDGKLGVEFRGFTRSPRG